MCDLIKQLVDDSNEVLPSWENEGFSQHPVAQIIQYSSSLKNAQENIRTMVSDCEHQIGWIEARKEKSIEELTMETNRVLPTWWKSFGFTQHPVAQIIQHSEDVEYAESNLVDMISDCRHQIGWINARRRNNCNEE